MVSSNLLRKAAMIQLDAMAKFSGLYYFKGQSSLGFIVGFWDMVVNRFAIVLSWYVTDILAFMQVYAA